MHFKEVGRANTHQGLSGGLVLQNIGLSQLASRDRERALTDVKTENHRELKFIVYFFSIGKRFIYLLTQIN